MNIRAFILGPALAIAATSAQPLALDFPGPATQTAERVEEMTSFRLPISTWDAGEVQTIWAEGALVQQAWQLPGETMTTLQILQPLRDQIAQAGFETIFECEASDCGGFDFRYATDVLPEPAMHVDLGDYRFLTAQRMGKEQPEYLCLMVSRSSTRGFVQIVRIGPAQDIATPTTVTSTKNSATAGTVAVAATGPLGAQLEAKGRAVLADLAFQTGSSNLGEAEFASLAVLADYLLSNPDRKIVLVGHTDAEGALDNNIALSKRRAQSVMQRLIKSFGIPAQQVAAQGVGYLAPLTSNLTDDGRTQNRRVEVILTSTR